MYVIATDEAGYGPKLGPLVISGTLWHLPDVSIDSGKVAATFSRLTEPLELDRITFRIADSKKVYHSGKGLEALEGVVGAGMRHCGLASNEFFDLVRVVCPRDFEDVYRTPWLELNETSIKITESQRNKVEVFRRAPPGDLARESQLISHWFKPTFDLQKIQARVITAKKFNDYCAKGLNKSDLLSMLTIELVASLSSGLPSNEEVAVYCDRHGGRRYYAGVLQNGFPDHLVRVIGESAEESRYALSGDPEMMVCFSVKGDSFAPVAYSSLVAKYLRERFMERLNLYFSSKVSFALKPTAGYPVDANRFLESISDTLRQEGINELDLVRQR
ncbi:MAG: hypothetical protein VXZ38_05550 [Planctomycetota bacterium]|nr:hypothetical protein [Planctomycetota bacterium]